VIDRGRRTILRRAIAPATAALQYMHNAADDPTIVRPLDAPNIRRQARFDPLPLLIAQPKQVSAHDPNPLPKTNQDRIVRAEKLMSSDPSKVEMETCGARTHSPWKCKTHTYGSLRHSFTVYFTYYSDSTWRVESWSVWGYGD